MASSNDIKIASLAAGFTIGFGLLTVWEAIKQTRENRNPLRSIYIYMLWGEIFSNLAIGIIGWTFLDGVISPTVPVLFFILFLWVFEVQLLMQIIVNRISIIAEHRSTIFRLKWGTASIMTAINIAVFCIWIPAHTIPPASTLIVRINDVWDRMSKVLILLIDAGLNWYFLQTVRKRLVEQHQLNKYKPLVGFNAKLMLVSISMDAALIGLMSLPNQVVYIQFHPVAYMVKLNIEISMAKLITRLARVKNPENYHSSLATFSHEMSPHRSDRSNTIHNAWTETGISPVPCRPRATSDNLSGNVSNMSVMFDAAMGTHKQTNIEVVGGSDRPVYGTRQDSVRGSAPQDTDDELPLTNFIGHPKQVICMEEGRRDNPSLSRDCESHWSE